MNTDKSLEEWAAEYGALRGTYEEFARRMEGLITDLLGAEGVDVIQVESRAKSVSSFAEKLRRKGRADPNPFQTITDLVGMRIITYYLDDVPRIENILRREFVVDEKNSEDKAASLASDQFGYRSAHMVAKLRSSRAKLIEWKSFANISVEFQVRTSLQHAWAAVSHKLEYKAAEEAPATLRRRLMRLSALFELADEQFAVLRDEREATLSAYREEVTEGRLAEIPIDTSSLAAFWTLSDRESRLRTRLKSEGFALEDSRPVDRERLVMDRADLARALRECGLDTLADLDAYLADQERLVPIMRALAEDNDGEDSGIILTDASMEDALTELLIIDMDRIDDLGKSIYAVAVPARFQAAREMALAAGLAPSRTKTRDPDN